MFIRRGRGVEAEAEAAVEADAEAEAEVAVEARATILLVICSGFAAPRERQALAPRRGLDPIGKRRR